MKIYVKKFTGQDIRPPGAGGSNTLVSNAAAVSGFFPAAKVPPESDSLKFYHGGNSTSLEYGYSGVAKKEIRIKNFAAVLAAEGVGVGDIGIFKHHSGEANAYDVNFIKQGDQDFDFYDSLNSGNHIISKVITDSEEDHTSTAVSRPHNWLIYGAPGTGKSNLLKEESAVFEANILRVTFYPDYSYSKFVGSYKPATYYKNSSGVTYHSGRADTAATNIVNEPVIDYTFVSGPFLTMLVKAWKGLALGENFLLIIEELNRAAAAAVFGEVFQLLDRKDGRSEYRVRLSNEAMAWIHDELRDSSFDAIRNDIDANGIYIPPNFYMWATMNSADQGVFPLDAAFKRRWKVEYLPLDANEEVIADITINFADTEYNWNILRKAINSYLTDVAGVAEDRLIAPFFLSPEELADSESARNVFKNKLLLYLKEDVLRHKKGFFSQANQTIAAINRHFGPFDETGRNWDFFSILTPDEGGAAPYIQGIYQTLAGEVNPGMLSNNEPADSGPNVLTVSLNEGS